MKSNAEEFLGFVQQHIYPLLFLLGAICILLAATRLLRRDQLGMGTIVFAVLGFVMATVSVIGHFTVTASAAGEIRFEFKKQIEEVKTHLDSELASINQNNENIASGTALLEDSVSKLTKLIEAGNLDQGALAEVKEALETSSERLQRVHSVRSAAE